ncbi:hypothetical protein J1N35_038520 [Gossypium stocksii]|uniref:Uncharacterized protein n=1 Tax=Gossypium stocksii TaxID=47602 RepID=A0A9D3UM65_9ROSI|nr:hypothetical protein J1N35_038520 [Gossypium stocksii]
MGLRVIRNKEDIIKKLVEIDFTWTSRRIVFSELEWVMEIPYRTQKGWLFGCVCADSSWLRICPALGSCWFDSLGHDLRPNVGFIGLLGLSGVLYCWFELGSSLLIMKSRVM